MNPKHPELLKMALLRFEFLTYRQITELFRGQIKGRSVERCIEIVAKSRFAQRHHCTFANQRIYTSSPTSFLALENTLAENVDAFVQEFHHRTSCTDSLLALARRSFVSKIMSEAELKQLKSESSVIGRRPDGLFTLERGNDLPIEVALEVETTLRSQERIRKVLERYVATFTDDPDRLSGVLIVAVTPRIVRHYREMIGQVSEKYQNRFLLSEKLDISDVKETILGRIFATLSDNPKSPLSKWAGDRPSKPLKIERTDFPRNTGYTRGDTDTAPTNGVKQ
jgi:hypothetical protein